MRVIKQGSLRTVHVARMGEIEISYRIFVGKHVGKVSFGRLKHIGEDNIKIGLHK
jgi:hypothetical protein